VIHALANARVPLLQQFSATDLKECQQWYVWPLKSLSPTAQSWLAEMQRMRLLTLADSGTGNSLPFSFQNSIYRVVFGRDSYRLTSSYFLTTWCSTVICWLMLIRWVASPFIIKWISASFLCWWRTNKATKTLWCTLHCVQKKTPTYIFFHISMSDVRI